MIGIIDLGIGNLNSIHGMLRKVGAESTIISDPSKVAGMEKIILPGVGAFDSGMTKLDQSDFRGPIMDFHASLKPILGICLGMQLMTKSSEEGSKPGLGLVDAVTKRFPATNEKGAKQLVPHMGWNLIKRMNQSSQATMQAGLDEECRFYFVHSYFVECSDSSDCLFETHYGKDFVSGFKRGNVIGVQFHPEKSHRFGMQFMKNFAEYNPC